MTPATATFVFLSLATTAVCQPPRWLDRPARAATEHHTIAYDQTRDRIVMFGGSNGVVPTDRTFEWDGVCWQLRAPARSPSARAFHAMAFDAARSRTVLFGGRDPSGVRSDTWEWDGENWSEVLPMVTPSPRGGAAMAFDPVRNRVWMFGGFDSSRALLDELWCWDGSNWTQVVTAVAPPRRSNAGLAFDKSRDRLVLFGGDARVSSSAGQILDDTWEWDGVAWLPRTPTSSPPPSFAVGMVFDPARNLTVLFDGSSSNPTWHWDGNAWNQPAPSSGPPTVNNDLVFDTRRARSVLVTASIGTEPQSWSLDAGGFARVDVPSSPQARVEHGLAYDDSLQRAILFGGLGQNGPLEDTWSFGNDGWIRLTPPQSPPATSGHVLAHDTARGQTLMVGGDNNASTWMFDGTTWIPLGLPTQLAQRRGHALAYDGNRQRIVLFGGNDPQGVELDDTWEWDGTSWSARPSATRPSARRSHTMAFDLLSRRVVMFGGIAAGAFLSDTWEWDGTNWLPRSSTRAPSARAFAAMTYLPLRAASVLHGGSDASGPSDETWEWDGVDWTPVVSAGGAPPATFHALVTDNARQRLVLYGGSTAIAGQPLDLVDTWEFGELIASSTVTLAAGCATTGAGGSLGAFGRPTVGNACYAVDLVDAAPLLPRILVISALSTPLPIGSCTLIPNPSVGVALPLLPDPLGFVSTRLAVPDDAGLRGIAFFAQSIAIDLANPFTPFVLSDALRLTIGD